DADNALMLSVAAFLLLTATRVTAEAICHLTGYSHRHLSYVYAAALCYIPVYILLYNLFGADLSTLGIYLPLLVVDSAVVKRMEFDDEESIPHAFRLGINNAIGMCISTMLVGCLRELLAAGTVFGYPVLNYAVLPMAGQVAGGFLVVGLLAAGWTAVSAMYVHYKKEEVRRLYAKRKS
ncbi:MAG: Rnf-Nqr domain containing protein, partial [Gemmiger sp.]